MRFTKKLLGVFLLLPLFLTNAINAFEDEDYTPQVTARVARITFLQGDVQVKRKDIENWERATQNLPLVEGDEITTGGNARLEIQFDSYNHLRLAENSYLKLTTLRDGGIALSLPQGTLILRALRFNKDNAFIEIDAPQTTLAVQKEGMYRVDAGSRDSTEIRLTATEKGEARVYSGNSGFTLKNGRTARIFLTGNLAGEWETADAGRFIDDFDRWALERDVAIAKRLRESYYDRYYDEEIYGADDLNEYGEWVYTRKYGYVWKPYRNSISRYSNWSPYRYGHWRWIPPYGWTWVNDEPWGWATYHYGRWVWDGGYWYWSPYGQYRWRRSWWSPALVVVTYSGGYICWYPLPYNYGYYNYNAYYHNTTIINNNTTVIVNPTPTPNPSPSPTTPVVAPTPKRPKTPPFEVIPQNGVVAVSADQFGKDTSGVQIAPANISKNVLAAAPVKVPNTPILPNYNQINGQISRNITAETPQIVKTQTPVKTGVIVRETGIPMSDRIQKERVLDNRSTTDRTTTNNTGNSNPNVRNTGAVTRPEIPVNQNPSNQTDRNTMRNPNNTPTNNNTVRSTGSGGGWNQTDRNTTRNNSNDSNNQQTDRNTQRNQQQTDRSNQNPPVRSPSNPPQQDQNQNQRQTPRNESQPSQRNEQPRQQQPQPQQRREEQKPQPQQQQRKTQEETDG